MPSTDSTLLRKPPTPADAGESEASRKLRALVRALARQAAREHVTAQTLAAPAVTAKAASDAG